jgi:hypothetical protein
VARAKRTAGGKLAAGGKPVARVKKVKPARRTGR